MTLIVLGLMAMPIPARAADDTVAMPSAGWHGRAIQNPRPLPQLVRTSWPDGWSAPVGLGAGYARPGGSDRVRDVQRRLVQLGYRPGAVDGLFGPRTRAATRWFQLKHGLPISGRVTRTTLIVLRARSDHEPLPTAERQVGDPGTRDGRDQAEVRGREPGGRQDREPRDTVVTPLPPLKQPAVTGDEISVAWIVAGLLILLALALGVLASTLVPALRRRLGVPASRTATPTSPPALPAPAPRSGAIPRPRTTSAPARVVAAPRPRRAPVGTDPRVLGYATVDGDNGEADAATAALALRCAQRGWSLVEVIHDRRDPGRSLTDRPGLIYAIDAIHARTAAGLVVARLRDFTSRVADLATLLRWLAEANAFLGAADHGLDTSTRAGRSTAGAVIELGRWERQRITERTRSDLAAGRFTPAAVLSNAALTRQIAEMHERGLSLRAIADALNLVGMPGPPGRGGWQITDVKAATEVRNRT